MINLYVMQYQALLHDKLTLGKDFIEELYVHMGFQKASAYRTVIDFIFSEGKLTSRVDRSKEAEKKRGQFKERYGEGDLIEDIDDAFSLDLDIE